MYVYIYMHMCTYVCIYVYMYLCGYVHAWILASMCVYMYMSTASKLFIQYLSTIECIICNVVNAYFVVVFI